MRRVRVGSLGGHWLPKSARGVLNTEENSRVAASVDQSVGTHLDGFMALVGVVELALRLISFRRFEKSMPTCKVR